MEDIKGTSSLICIPNGQNNSPCLFCHSSQVDQETLGPFYILGDIAAHYFCMLFSSGLSQKGADTEGILGFMPQDILKELRRSRILKCFVCGQKGASIGCCKKSCKMSYHFPCGLNNQVKYQFIKRFQSYCVNHYVPQEIVVPRKDWKCPICLEHVKKNPLMTSCCKTAVFHKRCLQVQALNAGYFFRCPMCNATKNFIQNMREMGIFVPEQDASWEKEPNAFNDLLIEYSKCDAQDCKCSKGRDYNAAKGDFILARCNICGSAGTHRKCGKLKTVENWECANCVQIIKKAELETPGTSAQAMTIPVPIIVDFAKIKIHRAAKRYFPYSKDQLKVIKKQNVTTLLDWRGFDLRVDLVDWLGAIVKPGSNGRPTLRNTITKIPPSETNRIANSAIARKTVARPPIPKIPLFKGYRYVANGAGKKKKRKKFSTKWGRGMVKARKIKKNKVQDEKKPETVASLNCPDIENEVITADTNNDNADALPASAENGKEASSASINIKNDENKKGFRKFHFIPFPLPPKRKELVKNDVDAPVQIVHQFEDSLQFDFQEQVIPQNADETTEGSHIYLTPAISSLESLAKMVDDGDGEGAFAYNSDELEINYGGIYWEHSYSKIKDEENVTKIAVTEQDDNQY